MKQKLAFADDHFHDECGVFGVFGHPEAANLAYLCLYALQHPRQQSAAILPRARGDALNQVEGACSLPAFTQDELSAVRDPRGFRPLVLGNLPSPEGHDAWVVASETCAFDLLDATYIREVEPGEMVRIARSAIESIPFSPPNPHQNSIFPHP